MAKLRIMSLSVEPEMQDLLKATAKKLGVSVSHLVRELVGKYLDLMIKNEEETSVILKIPNTLKDDEQELRKWLDVKSEAIVQALAQKEG